MFRSYACCAVVLIAFASSPAQEQSGVPAARESRDAWAEAFLRRLSVVSRTALTEQRRRDPLRDEFLRGLVREVPWYAVENAVRWIEMSSGGAVSGDRAKAARDAAQLTARMMADEHGAPALQDIVRAVEMWGRSEWRTYRAVRGMEAKGDALRRKRKFAGAAERYRNAAGSYRRLGRSVRATKMTVRLSICLLVRGRLRDAEKAAVAALQSANRLGATDLIGAACGNLANIAHARGQVERAYELYQRSLACWETMGDAYQAATTKFALCDHAFDQATREEAVQRAIQAIEYFRYRDPRRTALAHWRLATAYRAIDRGDAALRHAGTASRMLERFGSAVDRALAAKGIAAALLELGRFEESQDRYGDARARFEACGHRAGVASVEIDLGGLFVRLGRYSEAEKHYRTALSIAVRLRHDVHRCSASEGVGVALVGVGRAEEAIGHFERAIEIATRQRRSVACASAHTALGHALASLGRAEASLVHYKRAAGMLERSGSKFEIASAANHIGNACRSLGRVAEAAEHHRTALTIWRDLGNRAGIGTALSNLGADAYSRGDGQRAIQRYEEAATQLKDVPSIAMRAQCWENLGAVSHAIGEHAAAASYFRRAIETRKPLGEPSVLNARSWIGLAIAEVALGRNRSARTHFDRALGLVSSARRRISAEANRVAYMGKWRCAIVPAMVAALEAPDLAADPALAFRALETLRGMATADQTGLLERIVQTEERMPLAYHVRTLGDRIDALAARVAAAERQSSIAARRVRAGHLKQLRILEKEWHAAVERLERENPDIAWSVRPTPISLEHFQAMLPEKTAYLAFAFDPDRSMLLLVDREGVRSWRLPMRATIERAIASHLDELRTPNGRGGRPPGVLETGHLLYSLLFGPVGAALDRYDSLLVSVDGAMSALPLGSLVRAASDDMRHAHYVALSHAITYVPSATVWALERDRAAGKRTGAAALVFGDPAREGVRRLRDSREEAFAVLSLVAGKEPDESWRVRVGGADVEPDRLKKMLRTAREHGPEVRDVYVDSPSIHLRLGQAASRRALLDLSFERFRFIHLACHGFVDPQHPGLCALRLAPTGDDSGDVRVVDVMRLRLGAQLVVLSGCETALGKPTLVEGAHGLARAFHFAGAENVIASAFSVPDRATAMLLPRVYAALGGESVTVAAALREAKLAYLRSIPAGRVDLAHPHYWSAWMLRGTGR